MANLSQNSDLPLVCIKFNVSIMQLIAANVWNMSSPEHFKILIDKPKSLSVGCFFINGTKKL